MGVKPAVTPPKDWKQASDKSFSRDLVGGEIFMAWVPENKDGGSRFTTGLDLQTSYIDPTETENRLKNAWLRTRLQHPLLGVTLKVKGRGGTMVYSVFPDHATGLSWSHDTVQALRQPEASTLEELVHSLDNQNTHPPDGHAKLYFLPRSTGHISLILNTSHAVIDLSSSAFVWQTLIDEFAKNSQESVKWGDEIANLPRSIGNVMSEAYPQSTIAWGKTVYAATKAMASVTSESIRPPLNADLKLRAVSTESYTRVLNGEETARLAQKCIEVNTTSSDAYFAILALALQDLYSDSFSGPVKDQAQTFAMPYNGRRWLPQGVLPIPPHSPSFGNTTAYIRITHSGPPVRGSSGQEGAAALLRLERLKRILEFAAQFKEQSLKIMDHPIPEGVLASKSLVPLLIRAVEKSDPQKPSGALFGVGYQGELDKIIPARAEVEGSDITVVHYQNGGRTVDNNPMMMLYSWGGKLHARYRWNSKYFDRKTFTDIDSKVQEYLDDFVAAPVNVANK